MIKSHLWQICQFKSQPPFIETKQRNWTSALPEDHSSHILSTHYFWISVEYNRREVIELKFQAQKQSSGQLYFFRAEIGLVKKKGYQTTNQCDAESNHFWDKMILWLERWGKWCCIFIFNIYLLFMPFFLTLSSILIFIVRLLRIQWLYQVLIVRVLLPFNCWSCWECAGQSPESSNHVLLQDLMRTAPKRWPAQDRAGQTDCQMSCLLQWDEVSWSAVMELALTFQYLPVPVGRALVFHTWYNMASYYFLQVFNFVASFTALTSLHMVPCRGHPVQLYTRFRCIIWEAVCRWLWNPLIQLLASRF